MNAIDTNVLIYSIDSDEPVKQAVAVRFLESLEHSSTPTVLMWQVAGEFLNCLRRWQRDGKLQPTDTNEILSDLLDGYEVICPVPDVIEVANQLYARYSLSHWDSMLIAACIEAGVTTLFSEDMDNSATYETVHIVNPFA